LGCVAHHYNKYKGHQYCESDFYFIISPLPFFFHLHHKYVVYPYFKIYLAKAIPKIGKVVLNLRVPYTTFIVRVPGFHETFPALSVTLALNV
jgi:hypothetical protein